MRTLTFNRVIQDDALGTVYHADLQAPPHGSYACAAKVIAHATPDQDHFRARMRDAARLLPMIQHPRLLGVVELVHMHDRDAVLMDYVRGVDLSRLFVEGPVPPAPLARIGAEVAAVLAHAHRARHPETGRPLEFVHRDVKPDNVVLGDDGTVYLMDHGVARAAFEARESVTQGLVLGTLVYFAPEILSGRAPTAAADIYGIGVTLWEGAMARRWGQPQVHPQRFAEQVDDNLDALPPAYRPLRDPLLGMLQWDPGERPTADQVAEQLRDVADRLAEPTLARWAEGVVGPLTREALRRGPNDPRIGQTVEIAESVAAPVGAATPVPLDEPSELLPRGATLLAAAAAGRAPSPHALSSRALDDPLRRASSPDHREEPSWWMFGGALATGLLATSCIVVTLVAAVLTWLAR